MSRSGDLPRLAADIETARITGSHSAYRAHLERQRLLAMDIALMIAEDASESSAWLRDRRPAKGRVKWLSRLWLSLRLGSHGRVASDAVLEAAKAAVRAYAVHQEYIDLEQSGAGTSSGDRAGRYRTGGA